MHPVDRTATATPSRRTAALAIVAAAVVLTAIAASQIYFTRVIENEPPSVWRAFVPAMVTWFFWAAFAPGALWMTRRFPFRHDAWLRPVAMYLGVGILAAFGHAVLVVWASRAVYVPPPGGRVLSFPAWYGQYMLFQGHVELLTYAGVVGVAFATQFYVQYRRSRMEAAELAAQLATARLHALKAQLHPHFLFNTLNAITVLIRDDPETAMHTMALLGDFLRLTLAEDLHDEVPLGRELDFLTLYLEIERTRFVDRLAIALDVDEGVRRALVPHFVLQPLVENAVRYGVAGRDGPGRVEITARREGDRLTLAVWNDGSRLPAARAYREGIGLAATRKRLATLYGVRGTVTLVEERGGVVARVSLPYRKAAAGEIDG